MTNAYAGTAGVSTAASGAVEETPEARTARKAAAAKVHIQQQLDALHTSLEHWLDVGDRVKAHTTRQAIDTLETELANL
jgi:exosome complex RNA-binding protein Csl4